MKYLFTLLVSFFFLSAFAQYNHIEEGKPYCSHQHNNNLKTTDYLYNWQDPNMDKYDVKFYWLDLTVTSASTYIEGTVTIHATVTAPVLDTFAFELVPEMTIEKFILNGVQYNTYLSNNDNILFLVDPQPQGTELIAEIKYHGVPPSGSFFVGVDHQHNYQYNKDVTWTLSEPFNAKHWFPVKQDLEDKADSAWIFLTCDNNEMAGSEGLLTNVTDLGNGKHQFEWKTKYPIDYYLISFAVSDYMDYSIYAHPAAMNGDSLLIQNYIYNNPNCLTHNKTSIDKTAQIIEVYSDLFSLYPFHEEKYGHCLTELGGGMEHQTMTTMGAFNFHLIAHELGHMWFGDNVTCATWQDIWINEGFATYADYLANEKILGWNNAQSFIKNAQNSGLSQPGGSIYIPEDEIYEGNEWRIFNGRLSYNKGAAILHILRHEFQNDSLFFAGMQAYQIQYAGSTATGEDYKNVMQQFYGSDLDWFFDEWYYGEGYPKYNFEWFYDGTSKEFHLTSVQTTSASTPLFKMLLDVKLNFSDGTDTIVHFMQETNNDFFVSHQDKTVVSIEIDPDNWTMEKVLNITTGTPEIVASKNEFTLGPNPAKDNVTLFFKDNETKFYDIFIMDLSGKIIADYQHVSGNYTINVSDLKPGTYLITVSNKKGNRVKRFIKM